MRFLFITFILISLSLSSFSQNKAISETISITWSGIETIHLQEEVYKFLAFEDAVYDNKYGYIPVLYKKYAFPFSDVAITTEISNAVYEVMNEEETAVLESSAFYSIKNEISVGSKLVIERKHPFVEVFVVPFRKNENTGAYEKLVNFELKIFFDFNWDNANKKRTYKSSSVLATGNI